MGFFQPSSANRRLRLHPHEWLIIAYFTYVATLAPLRIADGEARWLAAAVAVIVAAIIFGLAWLNWDLRTWTPLGFALAAYRQMDWFTPAIRDHHLEKTWIVWDRWLLDDAHLRAAIEVAGRIIPGYLELCYLLVYTVAPVSVLILLFAHHRRRVPTFWLAYLAGTLGAYALLPYFPSVPPRSLFPTEDLPHIYTVFRWLNLRIVGDYGIHSSVFPSAHVSSTFAAAWGLVATMPEQRRTGVFMLIYGFSVAIATVYGRYHYAVDAIAGIVVSFLALIALRLNARFSAKKSAI